MIEKIKQNDKIRGIYLYVLELQEGKYYVGITSTPRRRINKHKRGTNASTFTRLYLPIISYIFELLETNDRKEAEIIETNKTIELINKYGIENVAGGLITGNLELRKKMFKIELSKRAFLPAYWSISNKSHIALK